MLLQSSLVGKAREIYSALKESFQYDVVKATVLKVYELVPEAYRQKFRDSTKRDNQTLLSLPEVKKHCSTDGVRLKKSVEITTADISRRIQKVSAK